MQIYPRNADNIHGTWIHPKNMDNIHVVQIYSQNADNIHRTWIFPWSMDSSKIIYTTRMKYCNLTHNFITHLYLLHGTQHQRTLTPRPRWAISLTQLWRPLPHFYPGAFYIFHITVWVLFTCIKFILWLAFKNGDTIFGCRPLKIHFGHRHSNHSDQLPFFLWTEYFHHRCVRK